jgi:hypothetical protein
MTNVPTLVVRRFWTEYKPDKNDPGKLVGTDMVAYGPMGNTDRSLTHAQIRHINCPRLDAPLDDQAANMARMRWDIIKPQYEAWKAGQEMPATGTPLAAWNAVSPEQAEILKARGIKTVEDVSHLTDTHFQSISIPGIRNLKESAKLFLASADTARAAAEMKKRDEAVHNLEAQNRELMDKLNELAAQIVDSKAEPKRGPGRPRKDAEAA